MALNYINRQSFDLTAGLGYAEVTTSVEADGSRSTDFTVCIGPSLDTGIASASGDAHAGICGTVSTDIGNAGVHIEGTFGTTLGPAGSHHSIEANIDGVSVTHEVSTGFSFDLKAVGFGFGYSNANVVEYTSEVPYSSLAAAPATSAPPAQETPPSPTAPAPDLGLSHSDSHSFDAGGGFDWAGGDGPGHDSSDSGSSGGDSGFDGGGESMTA